MSLLPKLSMYFVAYFSYYFTHPHYIILPSLPLPHFQFRLRRHKSSCIEGGCPVTFGAHLTSPRDPERFSWSVQVLSWVRQSSSASVRSVLLHVRRAANDGEMTLKPCLLSWHHCMRIAVNFGEFNNFTAKRNATGLDIEGANGK